MRCLDKKTLAEIEDKVDWALCLKEVVIKEEENSIELWMVEHDNCLVRDRYLSEENEIGFFLYVIMGGVGQFVNCKTKDLVEACQKFNTVLETIKV